MNGNVLPEGKMTNYRVTDWSCWPKPLIDLNTVKKFNQHIKQNFDREELEQSGAHRDGKLLKNIKPKIILLKKMPYDYKDVIELAFYTQRQFYGYNLYPYNGWDGLLYNTYSSNVKAHYGAHYDRASYPLSTSTKLTFLLNLSEGEYEGGDLIVDNAKTPFREPGSGILFKSELMHEVPPVTKGERITLTYFMEGPRFQ